MQYEDRVAISTPEGIELDIALAGLGSRFSATLIDSLIQMALTLFALLFFIPLFAGETPALFVALFSIWSFLVVFGYDVLFETLGHGRTIGKRAVGIRVVRLGGHPVGFVTSAVRNLVRLVDFLPSFYGVGIVSILASSKNQRLGDIAAGTLVVRDGGRDASKATRRYAQAAPFLQPAPIPPPPVEVAAWDVSSVTAQELAGVRSFLERRYSLEPAARWNLAVDLTTRLAPKVAGAPSDLHPEVFLELLFAAKAARI